MKTTRTRDTWIKLTSKAHYVGQDVAVAPVPVHYAQLSEAIQKVLQIQIWNGPCFDG